MLSIAYILIRERMQRHVAGARAGDPVLNDSVEEGADQPVDRLRPAQRRTHVALVAPQPSGRDEDLLRC